jgi:hypothetical protein
LSKARKEILVKAGSSHSDICNECGASHWVKWEQMCRRKECGGLGFRNLEWFNQAMLAKMGWRLIQNEHSLVSTVLKAKYFAGGTFMQAKVKPGDSFTWRSIAGARWVLEEGFRWRIGNGQRVRVWDDHWLPTNSTNKPICFSF